MKRQDSVEKIRRMLEKIERVIDTPVNDNDAPDGYVDRKTACRLLSISESVLRRKVDKGCITTITHGWRVYFSIEDIRTEIFRQVERRNADYYRKKQKKSV